MNDDTLARFIERGEHRYWGKYRGFVEDRDDEEQLGRLKVTVPSVLGDAVTGWAWPALPYAGKKLGFFFLPQVGDLVWIEFVEGDLNHPLWSGGGWCKPGGTTEIPDDVKANYPDTQVLCTKSGHVIIFEDKQDSEQIVIRDKSGSTITLKQDGTVSIAAKKNIELIANDGNGDITMKANKVSVTVTDKMEVK
jgi:uncharacterized protein involved in type VI secretion and phage assembly